jgi:hypothetical protein
MGSKVSVDFLCDKKAMAKYKKKKIQNEVFSFEFRYLQQDFKNS